MSIQIMANSARENIINEMNRTKELVFSGLVENVVVSRLPEDVFVNYFLPMFLSEVTNNRNWVAEWISIAGTPTAEVDIFNPSTGEVLFRVPGVLYTTSIGSDGTRFNDIFEHAKRINGNLPGSAANFLNEQLIGKAVEYVEGQSPPENKNSVWGYIVRRYRPEYLTQTEGTVRVQDGTASVDDFEY